MSAEIALALVAGLLCGSIVMLVAASAFIVIVGRIAQIPQTQSSETAELSDSEIDTLAAKMVATMQSNQKGGVL